MRPTTLRRLVLTAAAPLLALSLTACGGDDGSATDDPTTSASTPAGESPTPTDETSPDETSPDETETEAAEGEKVPVAGFVGRLQAAAEAATTASMTMTMDVSGVSITSSGDVDYTTDPPSMAMKMTNPMAGGEMDIRFVDGTMYMNMGQASGGKFYKLTLEEMSQATGTDLTEQMDPMKSIESFTQGVDTITYLGTESVDGEDLEAYEMTLDTTKVDQLQGMGGQLPKKLTYQVWLDDEDRMRRTMMDMGKLGTMQMDVFDWGQPVEISAPPANQVTEMPGT